MRQGKICARTDPDCDRVHSRAGHSGHGYEPSRVRHHPSFGGRGCGQVVKQLIPERIGRLVSQRRVGDVTNGSNTSLIHCKACDCGNFITCRAQHRRAEPDRVRRVRQTGRQKSHRELLIAEIHLGNMRCRCQIGTAVMPATSGYRETLQQLR